MKKIDAKIRKEIFESFCILKNKSQVAKKFGCDPKTVSNIIKEFKNPETEKNVDIVLDLFKKNEDSKPIVEDDQKEIPKYIITDNTVIVVKEGTPRIINKDNIHFSLIKDLIKKNDWDLVFEYLELSTAIVKFSYGRIQYINENLYVDGKILYGNLSERIIQGLLININVDKYINFLSNVIENPLLSSIEGLFNFIESNCIEITDDGYFLAFKTVTKDFLDIFTQTIDNSVGQVIKMDRNDIDPDPNRTCSRGLHVCSSRYLKNYGNVQRGNDKIVLCQVDPKDVCAVPTDYNNAKLRCCEYKVIMDITKTARKQYIDAKEIL